ncbi:MAG: class I tRNA ligase family protein, partial [Methyloligellaceae bacterium]
RRAVHVRTGAPLIIGPVEKMSKSKHNTVDPEDIIGHYGADTIRWFMLSDSPPERDVQWTEAGVEGAWRFVQRLWRLMGELGPRACPAGCAMPDTVGEEALALRRAAHKTLHNVSSDIEALRFNRAVAQIYEFTNTLSSLPGADGEDMAWALREALEILIILFGPMMPHLGEECWKALNKSAALLAETPWPEADSALLVEDMVTIAVQVNGKRRDELTVAREASKEDIEAAALKLENVLRAIEGREIRKVIIVPQRIVNVVA